MHHGHHGHGFGRFAMGMGNFIQDQMRAARREVASEQIGSAVAELSAQVSEVLGSAGQQDGLQAAQEGFSAALQDVVDRFDSGEIGRRRAMAGFRDAFEQFVSAVKSGASGEAPVAETSAAASDSAEAAAVSTDAESVADADAGVDADADGDSVAGGSLVASLGQAFNTFVQTLRSDFEALGSMRSFLSAENRDKIHETFVNMYRELAGLDGAAADAVPAGVDQLA